MEKSTFSLDESMGTWKMDQNIFLWLNFNFYFLR